jgi:tetratricopeptide (TPR) repeat protein
LEPKSSDAYYNLGIIHYRLKKFDIAMADFTTIIEQKMPNIVQALNMRAIIHITRNDYDLALDDLTAAIETDPAFASSYYKRALVFKSLGKATEAIADSKKFLEIETDPDLRQPAIELLNSLGG